MTELINVLLTESQIHNLVEFIEINFIDSIRNDPDIDNIEYIKDMIEALDTLRRAERDSEEPFAESEKENDN